MWRGATQGPEYQEATLNTGSQTVYLLLARFRATEPRKENHKPGQIGFSVDSWSPAPEALYPAWQCAVYCASLANLSSHSLNSYFKTSPFPPSPLLSLTLFSKKWPHFQFYRKKKKATGSPSSSYDQAHMYLSSLTAVAIEELLLPLKADPFTCALDPASSPFQEPCVINHPPANTHIFLLFHATIFFPINGTQTQASIAKYFIFLL